MAVTFTDTQRFEPPQEHRALIQRFEPRRSTGRLSPGSDQWS